MSSREIAEYTGKNHKNVLADIRTMFDQLEMTSAEFSANLPDIYGRMQPGFRLPKDLTITLVSGYSAPMRHAIVKRWMELEAQAPAQLKVSFTFAKGMTLRAVLKDNQPWFVAADVCEALGYTNTTAALAKHVDDDDRMPLDMNTVTNREPIRGNPRVSIINESGLYSLILKSRKPEAIAFKKWVTGTVLPYSGRRPAPSVA